MGTPVVLTAVAVRDAAKPRPGVPADLVTADAAGVAASGVNIVVEVMGASSGRTLILSAIAAGSSVVTANKALLAADGATLYEAAARNGVDLYFEAADLAGAIPLLRPLRESLAADQVTKVLGIVNGTTNYILTRMSEEGLPFAEVLAAGAGAGLRGGRPDRRRRGQTPPTSAPSSPPSPSAGGSRRRDLPRGHQRHLARGPQLRPAGGQGRQAARHRQRTATASRSVCTPRCSPRRTRWPRSTVSSTRSS